MARKVQDFLKIKNLANNKAEIYFIGDIVSDEWEKWSDIDKCPQDVIDYLDTLNEFEELDIYINSGGGSLFAGIGIYNILNRHKGYKTVYIDGLAGSIASVIAMAGNEIICPSNSFLMIHKPLVGLYGNAIELREMADTLDRLEEGIINTYKTKLKEGISIETIIEMVNNETWLNGEEASKYFNITVVEPNKAVAKIDINQLKNSYSNIPKELLDVANCKLLDKLNKEIDLALALA